MEKIKLVCYGAGKGLDLTYPLIDFDKAEVVAIVDGDADKQGLTKYEVPIVSPQWLSTGQYDRIMICSKKYEEMQAIIVHILGDAGADVFVSPVFRESYDNDARRRETLALNMAINRYEKNLNDVIKPEKTRGYRHFSVTDLIAEHERPLKIENFLEAAGHDYIGYVRLAALQLLAEQVHKNHILGDMAELGVYKGHFARSMNELLPNRRLYLFDTFEGFDKEDLAFERNNDYLLSIKVADKNFQDTTLQDVLARMPHPQSCIVRKGYFPDTAEGLPEDIKYALVSIDADIYKPIYAGLNYFYDHLSPGGYIMVHDCNQMNKWAGATEAVDQFCRERAVFYVPIPDECGSVIFTKFH